MKVRPSLRNKLPKTTIMALTFLFILTLVLAACAPVTPAGSDSPGTEPEEVEPSPSTQPGESSGPTPTLPPRDLPPGRDLAPGAGAPQVPETPIIGEVPEDLLAKMYAYMQDDLGLDPTQFTLVRAESVIWPDGSLGCPQPGMMYTMALVEGYWVQLVAGEQLVDFRATQNGGFQLCQQSDFAPPLRPESTPNQ